MKNIWNTDVFIWLNIFVMNIKYIILHVSEQLFDFLIWFFFAEGKVWDSKSRIFVLVFHLFKFGMCLLAANFWLIRIKFASKHLNYAISSSYNRWALCISTVHVDTWVSLLIHFECFFNFPWSTRRLKICMQFLDIWSFNISRYFIIHDKNVVFLWLISLWISHINSRRPSPSTMRLPFWHALITIRSQNHYRLRIPSYLWSIINIKFILVSFHLQEFLNLIP